MLKLETEGTEKTEMQSSKAPATAEACSGACKQASSQAGSRVSREIPSGDLVNDGSREPARVVRLGIA